MRSVCVAITLAGVLLFASGCIGDEAANVVVYTALDEMYSQPILTAFTEQTGIIVRPVYDTEASKTTGMVSRLIAERDRPRADVFWNNETAQTIVLKSKGVLEAYHSPSAESIPSAFKDPEGYWTGFAARGRVIIYNTDLVKVPPSSIHDLLKPEWAGRAAIAKPLFGTTATHAAALFAAWGDDDAKSFFQGLKQNQIAILAGNATVRDQVAAGEYAWGLTDTDDANGAVEDGRPAKWLYPDQGPDGLGTLVIPNTVALVKGAPHPDAAKKLIDYLLSPQVEEALSKMRSIQIPLNPNVNAPERVPKVSDTRTMAVTFEDIAARMESTAAFVKEEFLQ
ncbi:MAG: extracellular solute-binding protein [Candidatus Hydrogenedentes bacterium]|nr:extracellular solute-binding protein [Candidatus Hydrogenedentota bacterium]